MTKRVMIYVDGSNLYHTLKANNLSTRIDFYKYGISRSI
jgi:hypothetical protein